MASKLKKEDKVIVLTGKYRGVEGEILKVMPRQGKALVKGINKVKKHTKPSASSPEGGIIEKEMPIDLSNIGLLDKKSGKPTRVGFKIVDGKKKRYGKKSGEIIDG